ncbi:MAG: prepilin peptidase [Myxococcales bacterium]|nr:prepilin peptidase [Myxococcales bacterium]
MTAIELPLWFVLVFSFVFGAAWGSFANVVVYRWPLGLSVVSPPSRCPSCETNIRAFDNVPIFAWLWLRGRCRSCRAPISPRYAIVELVFALLSTALAYRLFVVDAPSLAASVVLVHYLVRFSVVFALVVVALIDLDRTEVPDFVLLFAVAPIVAALGTSPIAPAVDALSALAGAGLGYFGLRLLFIDGLKLVIGRAGMGLGDAHLLVVVGAMLGPAGVLFSLGAGAVQGVAAAAIAAALGRRIGADDVDEVEDVDDEQDNDDTAGSETDDATATATEQSDDEARAADGAELAAPSGRTPMKLPFAPFLGLAALEYMLFADVLVARWLAY